MLKASGLTVIAAASLVLSVFLSPGKAGAEDVQLVFELDCVSFAGRFLAEPPLRKKMHPGLAVDGTTWEIATDTKKVLISRVFPGEAAEQAGLEPGDEVLSVNGYLTDGLNLREVFCAYHMYDPDTLVETLTVRKKDGSEKTLKLKLLTVDKCHPEERIAWLNIYKSLGF